MTPNTILLATHIAAGSLSAATGVGALVFRKGGKSHRTAGSIFVGSMIILGATAAALGRDLGNFFAGGMTIYMVSTAWVTGRRKDKEAGPFEIVAFVIAIACAIAFAAGTASLVMGLRKADNPFIIPVSFMLTVAVTLAALGDLSVVLRRGVSGSQRIARHLWRMCFALFIAVGSFMAQGAQVLPPGMPRQQILLASMVLVLGVMFFWLTRVLVLGVPKQRKMPASIGPGGSP